MHKREYFIVYELYEHNFVFHFFFDDMIGNREHPSWGVVLYTTELPLPLA